MPNPGAPRSLSARLDSARHEYDALLVLSFGGPEGMADVMPFLENVTRGRNIPRQRLAEVATHYEHFAGVSPINAQNRALIAALERELADHHISLPIYFGNRNWHPYLEDTLRLMRADGVARVLVFVTSAYSSYSGCRQYREDISRALATIGDDTMHIDKLRVFYNHPGFIMPMAASLRDALATLPSARRERAAILFTAHSIPCSMARGSAYERQLREASHLVAEHAGVDRYQLAWQSRSGPPHIPWLEPDVLDVLDALSASGASDVVIVPIGFISDHLEVLYDLDLEAQARASALGMSLLRIPTVGVHPDFVAMIRELIEERLTDHPVRRAIGMFGPSHDVCALNCCRLGESHAAAPARATA